MHPEFKWENIRVAVGLGNPGAVHQDTCHNVGRAVLGALAGAAPTALRTPARKRFSLQRENDRVLVTPHTFMNESGAAVAEALRYCHAKPTELLVIHDDADLPLGAFRLCFGRGAAGHRGVHSVIAALRTKDFWRLRIGIRPKVLGTRKETVKSNAYRREPRMKAGDLVLRHMTVRERAVLDTTTRAIRRSLIPQSSGGD